MAVGLAASLVAISTLTLVTPAAAASPAVLPVTVTNNTGQSGPVYLYVLGLNLDTNKLGYVNASGTFTPWSLPGGPTAVPAPDASITGPTNGSAVTLKVPKNLSGRVYFAFGQKLDFALVDAGLVQPAPWNKTDKNSDNLFDWSEFTFNTAGLWLNSSQVDQFAVPHEVNVTGGDGAFAKTGNVVPGGREKVIAQVKATPGYEKTVMTGGDGKVLRVLAPGKATGAGLMSATYLDDYIDQAWSAYATRKLTVVPFEYSPEKKFYGTTSGDTMSFTDTTGRQVAQFEKPTTSDVWDCDGNLAAPNDQTVGPIARTLCAALHRGTLGDSTTEPVSDVSTFYQQPATNHFSAIVHANMVDKKAYGFAFDDVTHQESLVHSGDPQKAGIVLDPFQ
ncbi:MAG TPA: beta-1,3-glucanase family protein [Propionibacteriaceae bacterium]